MIAPNNIQCRQIEPYYYDFLQTESHDLVPQFVVDHIGCCQNCQEQVNRLREILLELNSPDSEHRLDKSDIATILKLNFGFIGTEVTCKVVRPFLPGLLVPALAIRIPTPITVHLDNCQQCVEDLKTIRSLNLERKHLYRLSQLFAESPRAGIKMCEEARSAVSSVVAMIFSEIDSETLKHLCICPDCRGLIYRRREMVRKGLLREKKILQKFPCQKVSIIDIFDYAIPYGIDPKNDQYEKFRESLVSHLRICPACLAKIQQLYKTVYEIVERPESGIVTIYNIDESAEKKAFSEPAEPYAGFPISVGVTGKVDKDEVEPQKQPAPTISFKDVTKQKTSSRNLKPLVKTAVAAAAVLLIGIALFLNIPAAKAVTLEKIYRAIEAVKNVHISSFVPGRTEPEQEKWVFRTLNVYMTKTGKQLVLWDIVNQIRKDKHLDTGQVDTIPLTNDVAADAANIISGSLGLMPFYDISEVPSDAQWNRATVESEETTPEQTEVYELKWPEENYDGSVRLIMWRVFVDPETSLPQKIELYEKITEDDEYIFQRVRMVGYLSDTQMRLVLEELSF